MVEKFQVKKYLSAILIIILFTSCENGEKLQVNQEEVFYPSEDRFSEEYMLAEIELNSVENYAQLYEIMENNACDGKTSIVKFSHRNQNYNILGGVECPRINVINCFFRVNHIYITGDSLIYDYDIKLPVEKLNETLTDLMSDPHKYKFQTTSMKPAVIWYHGDENQSIEVTKDLLVRITSEFDNINKVEKEKFPYYINFEPRKYQKIPPPPPPPPPPPFYNGE